MHDRSGTARRSRRYAGRQGDHFDTGRQSTVDDDRLDDVTALLVARAVLEPGVDDLHPLQSVTKSFTSAAIGIAIASEEIKALDEPVLSFFEDLEGIDNIDERKQRMVIEDLLTMRSGTDYHERGPEAPSPHRELNALSRGWTEFVLSRPMISEPGTSFRYDSGGVILLSAVLKASTGQHADAYLAEHLFEPLGIKRTWWFKNAEGHPHTGGGLMLTSRDMAKFGLLYLRNGAWDGEQIVPAEWVRKSTEHHSDPPPAYGPFSGYGYLWWLLEPAQEQGVEDGSPAAGVRAYAACGYMAQYIIVVPEHDMVVVVTAHEEQRRPGEAVRVSVLAHPAFRDGRIGADPGPGSSRDRRSQPGTA